MILFPGEVQAIEDLLEQRAGIDPELRKACQEHIDHGQHSDAVFKAFRVLEGRIRQRSGVQGETAAKTLHLALKADGPLTKKLALNRKQAANFRDLLVGAFAFFRNPEAHPGEAVIDYGSSECKAVLVFVNLMLGVLDRQPEDPMQAAQKEISRDIGKEAAEDLAEFVGLVLELDLHMPKPQPNFSFRAWAQRPKKEGAPPERLRTSVFWLNREKGNPHLLFPTWQWTHIVDFDHKTYIERLKALGCAELATPRQPRLALYLREHNSAETFAQLYIIIRDILTDMEHSVTLVQAG